MKPCIFIPLILAFTLSLSACNEAVKCDIHQAVKKAELRAANTPLVELTVGLKNDATSMALIPSMISQEETEGQLVPQSHLSTGAKLQLLDQKGVVLFEDNVPNLIEARQRIGNEILKTGDPAQIAEFDRLIQSQAYAVQVPRILEATRVRLTIEDPDKSLASLSTKLKAIPTTFDFKLSDIPRTSPNELDELAATGGVKIEPIHYSGNSHQRLNIIIISDGYRDAEMPRFRIDVEKLKKHILGQNPFSQYTDYFNIWRVEVPSAESGANCDDNKYQFRKIQFGTTFPVACINAIFKSHYSDRFIIQTNIKRVLDVARLVRENGKSVPSQIFVLANSPKYGGTAIYWASQNNTSSPEVFTHELGHSFGGLADEYTVPGDPCMLFNLFKPNVSFKRNKIENVKWARWIENGTPIPTPDTKAYVNTVGLFQGASDCPKLFYRPERTCKMQSNYGSYCHICREQIMLRLYDYVRPLHGKLVFTRVHQDSYQFAAQPSRLELDTHWYVDGKEERASATYSPLSIHLKPGKHTVALSVRDANPYIRQDLCHFFEARAVQLEVK